MSTKPSKNIRLKRLAQDIGGITVTDVQRILDSEYPLQPVDFTAKHKSYTETTPRTEFALLKRKSIKEKISEANDVADLWELLSSLSSDNSEYPLCYEKLVSRLKTEIAETDNMEELRELYRESPTGSHEECTVVQKLRGIERKEIENENEMDTLITMYESNDYDKESDLLIFAKIIQIAKTPEETKNLLENICTENTPAYYTAYEKHIELIKAAIARMTDVDDADEIYGWILSEGDDEEILLAQKIVAISKDSETIWSKQDIFNEDSEAREILAFGAINLASAYDTDGNSTLDEIHNAFNGCSRVGRVARKKEQELLLLHIQSLNDPEEISSLLNNFEDDNPNRKIAEDKLVSLTGIDELKELIEDHDSSGYLVLCAQKKLYAHIKSTLGTLSIQTIGEYLGELDELDELSQALFERAIQLAKDADDLDDISLPSISYAMYLFTKKFPAEQSNRSRSDDSTLTNVPTNNMPSDSKKRLISVTTCEDAIALYHELEPGDPNKPAAYKRASELLWTRLKMDKDKSSLLRLMRSFPSKTEEWSDIIKALSHSYKKPAYMFW